MAQVAFRRTYPDSHHPNHSGSGPIPRAAWFDTRLPGKPDLGCCPHCMQSMQAGSQTTIQKIRRAIIQLFSAFVAIVFCVLRLARLFVAVVFSLVGVLGFGMQTLGSKIAHPDDRRLLPRLGSSQ